MLTKRRAQMAKIAIAGLVAIGCARNSLAADPHRPQMNYEAVYANVQAETDQGRLLSLYERSRASYLKNKDLQSGFTWAVCHLTIFRLWEAGLSKSPRGSFEIEDVRKALLKVVDNEKASGYPLAEYARFVQYHREPLMPAANNKLISKGMATLSNGKKVPYEHYVQISDEPKAKRVKAFVDKALAIEPDNKFALFMLATIEKDPVKAISLSWRSIDRPGKRLWEFNALAYIKTLAKNDKETLDRVDDWVAKAKAVVGNTIRAKSRGF